MALVAVSGAAPLLTVLVSGVDARTVVSTSLVSVLYGLLLGSDVSAGPGSDAGAEAR